jgi:hypothetical protein
MNCHTLRVDKDGTVHIVVELKGSAVLGSR